MSLRRLIHSSPVTVRGLIFFLAGIYLAIFPAWHHADIIASVVGPSLVCLALLFIVGVYLNSRALENRNDLQASLVPAAGSSDRVVSQRPSEVIVKFPYCRHLPLVNSRIQIDSAQTSQELRSVVITGSLAADKSQVHAPLLLPHRGQWKFKPLTVETSDYVGVAARRFTDPTSAFEAKVHPPIVSQIHTPVISSLERSGDLSQRSTERKGDLFDLKPYHPADGARRVLWKVFARKGELLSRLPEAATTPDGTTVVFALAPTQDDAVASCAIAYTQKLQELDIRMFAGCLGATDGVVAQDPEEFESLLIESAWSATELKSAQPELLRFLESVRAGLPGDQVMSEVVLFIDAGRAAKDPTFLSAIDEALAQQSCRAHWAIVNVAELPGAAQQQLGDTISRWTNAGIGVTVEEAQLA